MSRTYRTKLEWRYDAYGRLWTWDELDKAGLGDRYLRVPCVWPDPVPDWAVPLHKPGDLGTRVVRETPGLNGRYVMVSGCRDRKPWDKPDKGFKRMWRRIERAVARQAMARHQPVPRFPKYDQWHWT